MLPSPVFWASFSFVSDNAEVNILFIFLKLLRFFLFFIFNGLIAFRSTAQEIKAKRQMKKAGGNEFSPRLHRMVTCFRACVSQEESFDRGPFSLTRSRVPSK